MMRRKQLLNFAVTFIFVFAVQHIFPAEGSDLCLWCNERLQDNFVNCLYFKILSNPVFNILSPSIVDDMEMRLLTASGSMARIPNDIKREKMDDVLAGEMSEMVMSLTSDDSTQNSYYSTMEEAVQLAGKCYSVATGRVNVNFVENFRTLLQDTIQYRTASINRFSNSMSNDGTLYLPNPNQQGFNDDQRTEPPIPSAQIHQQIPNSLPNDETISFPSPNQQGFNVNERTGPNIQPVPIPQQTPSKILSFPSNDETLYLSNPNKQSLSSNQRIESPSQPVSFPQKIFEGPSVPSPVLANSFFGNVLPNSNALGTQNNEFTNWNFPVERPLAENIGVNQYVLNPRQEDFPTNFESIPKDNFSPVLNNVKNFEPLVEQTIFQMPNDKSPDIYSEIKSSQSNEDTNADSKPSAEESMKINDDQNSNDSKPSAEKSTNTTDDQNSDDSKPTSSVNSSLTKFSNVLKSFFKNYNVSKKDIPPPEEKSKNTPENSTVVSEHKSQEENNVADLDKNVDNPTEFERLLGTVLSNTISDYETDENLKILISGAERCISPSGFDFQNYVSIMTSVAESLQKNHPDWSPMKCHMKMYSLTVVAMSHSLQEKIASNIENTQSEPFLSDQPDSVATQSLSNANVKEASPVAVQPQILSTAPVNNLPVNHGLDYDLRGAVPFQAVNLPVNHGLDYDLTERGPELAQSKIYIPAKENNPSVKYGLDYHLTETGPLSIQSNTRILVRESNPVASYGLRYDVPATEPMATDSRYGNIQSFQTQYDSDYNSGFGMV